MCIPVHSPWLPGYTDVMQTVLFILTMAGLFPDVSHTSSYDFDHRDKLPVNNVILLTSNDISGEKLSLVTLCKSAPLSKPHIFCICFTSIPSFGTYVPCRLGCSQLHPMCILSAYSSIWLRVGHRKCSLTK